MIEKVEIFHILTDTDSTALKFIFISDPNSNVPEVIIASKLYKRFDTSHEFWDILGSRKENRRKKLGYYKIENNDNPCVVTLAVNPKEYLEILKNLALNKTQRN